MRALALFLAAGIASAVPAITSAQELIPPRRSVILPDMDLPGGDIASLFDTSLQACERACFAEARCEAFTFNARNNSCFLKNDPGAPSGFDRATSARVVSAPEGAAALARTRRSELRFVQDWELNSAVELAQIFGREHPAGETELEQALDLAQMYRQGGDWQSALSLMGVAVNLWMERPDYWLEYAQIAQEAAQQQNSNRGWYRDRALRAAINGYLRAESAAQRHSILLTMAELYESMGRGRDMLQALRLAQSLQPRDDTAALLEEAAARYGFRVEDQEVEADLARPRICARFTEDLQSAGVDYADYLRLPDPALSVELAGSRQLCVTGVQHGQRYEITLREGLPAADGQTLLKDVSLSLYVRDRRPTVAFPGRGYVLPKAGEPALPVQTVNAGELDLEVYRVSDRNILRSIQENYFGTPLYAYEEEDFAGRIGSRIWVGKAKVAQEVNRDVTTRLPMTEALKDQPTGIYVLRAAVPGLSEDQAMAAWQWFVVSDLGLTSMSGVDGLHVFVRSLASAGPKAGVKVELLSRANEVLATLATDDQGYARFDAGLVRGRGSAAPGMLVARIGEGEAIEDLAFLSLTDPEFDLSDRGVAGREAAPPVDVFLTTDRGAYRAGETVHATALVRDPEMVAIEGLPLTAVLTRPDGVEYSRQLVNDGGAGGHVFALPIAGTAQRGTWTLSVYSDTDAPALSRQTFLVEDFLPERIDFTIDAGEGELAIGQAALPLKLEAKYLFGAPAAGLAVEGELVLRSAEGLEAWPGYRFGRHDERFDPRWETILPAETGEDGSAIVSAALPQIEDPGRPLTAQINLRIAEGSGRPVERKEVLPVVPAAAMIGVKPGFDNVAPEGEEARFQLIGVGTDLKPAPMKVKWELTRIQTEYQWYQSYGDWSWEPVTYRSRVAEGEADLGDAPVEIGAKVDWGHYELSVARVDGAIAETAMTFWAGWYAPADVSSTPDTLELSLDKPAYAPGDEAQLRLVPRAAGTALVTVLSNRLIAMKAVEVKEGENIIPLDVTEDWGTGVYVTASVFRPMDAAAGRNPARALGLAHASIAPGKRALLATVEAPKEADPRGPLDVAVRVEGVAPGETAYVTVAAVDQGILNLTGFKAPDPQAHYFGQRKLGVGIRDLYGRLIDGLNGAQGEVRSGGDAGAQARLQAPPPTEELVAYFSGPLEVGADGYARTSFDLPAFNGSVRVMAVAWSKSAVGQDDAEVLVRDPVVVTASLPRFMAPGDESRLLLEFVHASGPAGAMTLRLEGEGLGDAPAGITLAEKGKAVVEVPIEAGAAGLHEIRVVLTTPDGRDLVKTLALPVQVNDPEVARITRLDLGPGQIFTLDQSVFADMLPGTGRAVLAVGPLAQLNAPGVLAALDRYPYGCTEQVTSLAMPLLYHDQMAKVLGLKGAEDVPARIRSAVTAVLANQSSDGGFGLWRPGSGDLWLDAYVTDFLSRARAMGHEIPEQAFRNALSNLRNQVNYAPDFDRSSNGGGEALAYALMVLAREGGAAIGDLRYYADVKGDDFATPLAQAQLGAALAAYGDQIRADRMFRKAAAAIEALPSGEAPRLWRSDYGTPYRDVAAVLTLAAEARSEAVDAGALANRLSGLSRHLSTQEAAWTLMAASALFETGGGANLRLDGEKMANSYVKLLEQGAGEVSVANEGSNTTLTLTTYGIPAEPEPAGGNGYAIRRSYYTLDGQPASLDGVRVGDRMVVVLDVTPFDSEEGRLMVADPLPAGFEIDNPNLLSSGSTSQFAWLDSEAEAKHTEFRQDRFLAAIDWASDQSFRLAYVVRAISPGNFRHPAASVEDMYNPNYRARSEAGRIAIAAK